MAEITKHKLIVIGGSTIAYTDGVACTKQAIADYLLGLASRVDELVFISVRKSDRVPADMYKGRLAASNIRAIAVPRGKLAWPGLVRHALREAADSLIITFLPGAMPLYPFYGLLRRRAKRWAAYIGGDFIDHAPHSGFARLPGGLRFYLGAHEKALRLADVVIARGQKLAEIAARYNDNVHQTIPLAHLDFRDPPVTRSEGDPDQINVLYVGKIMWRKGLRELIDALVTYAAARPDENVRLDLVGDGTEMSEVREYALSTNLGESIHFAGWVEDAAVLKEYWGRADVLAMPSSIHKEGVPRVIDEALYHGVPVVATRIGGVPEEFVNGEVLLVEPASASELFHGIVRLRDNAEAKAGQVERGRARLERWRRMGSAAAQHAALVGLTDGLIGD